MSENEKAVLALVLRLTEEAKLQGVRVSDVKVRRIARGLVEQDVEIGTIGIMCAIVGATS